MSRDAPKLTEPQLYRLGVAVQNAFGRNEWDGNLKAADCPVVHDSTFNGGASPATIKAMLRANVIRPSAQGKHKLTSLGVELGEGEVVERTGTNPRQLMEEGQAARKVARADRLEELTAAFAPVADLRFTRLPAAWGSRPRKKQRMSLGEFLIAHFQDSGSEVEFKEQEIKEIVSKLR